jgi:arginyl-tRNA synthetase
VPTHRAQAGLQAGLVHPFRHEHHILREADETRQSGWLGLSRLTLNALELVLDLLGIQVPERM